MKKSITTASAGVGLTRRALLAKSAFGLGLLALGNPLNAMAQSLNKEAINRFTSVSAVLTERDDLHPVLCERFYTALNAKTDAFDAKLTQLAGEMQNADTTSLADTLSADAQQTAKLIVSAWYTGIVGEETNAQVIAYRNALQFQAVDDVLVVRSYCPNKPGFWAIKPIEEKV